MAGGKHSVTHYATLEAHRFASLLEVNLETGRTHQIRVHMAALKHPCVGDPLYGADPVLAARIGLNRQWLHAVRLGFEHPDTGEYVEYESEYPDDLQRPSTRSAMPSEAATRAPVEVRGRHPRGRCGGGPPPPRGAPLRADAAGGAHRRRGRPPGWPRGWGRTRSGSLRPATRSSATPGSPRAGSTTSTWTPAYQGQGVGGMLLDTVKALHPGGFGLWVFESNDPARRFYARHGLVELEHTDGSGNEERMPDVRMVWPGADPVRSCAA